MTDRSTGPRCGNNPNTRLTPGDRKAVDDAKARLALQAAAKPYIERAAWVDFDPLMEVIASTLWEHCGRDSDEMPQLVCDDPRTIAALAAAVARAEAEAMRERHKASLQRADEINNQLMEEVQRYAAGTERPVLWSVYNRMHLRAIEAETELEKLRRAAESEPADRAAARADAPVKQRADCTELEWAVQERARFEQLYTRETVRADLAEQRADTAARDAGIYQQRLERLGEGYTEQRKRAEAMERAMESTAADASAHRFCHMRLMAQCQRAEQAEAAVERVRSVLESEAVIGQSALGYRGLIASALMASSATGPSRMADETPQPETVPWGVCPDCRAAAGPDCDCPPAAVAAVQQPKEARP